MGGTAIPAESTPEADLIVLPDRAIAITAYRLAERFVGVAEVPGPVSNPHVLAMLRLDAPWPKDDSTAWCSAFVNYIAWLLRLPRSKSLAARSWLGVGLPIDQRDARAGFDVVVLKRGFSSPGPEVRDALGHVGFFAGWEGPRRERILVLGGNQKNQVSVEGFAFETLLGIRRLA